MKKTFLYALTATLILGGAPQAMAESEPAPMPDKAAIFDMIDSDGDGNVSREEFAKKRMHHKKEKRDRMLKEIDQNEDGIISEEEFIERSRKRFSTLDADADGKVTKDEVSKHHEMMKEKQQARREKRHERRQDRRDKASDIAE